VAAGLDRRQRGGGRAFGVAGGLQHCNQWQLHEQLSGGDHGNGAGVHCGPGRGKFSAHPHAIGRVPRSERCRAGPLQVVVAHRNHPQAPHARRLRDESGAELASTDQSHGNERAGGGRETAEDLLEVHNSFLHTRTAA